MGHPWLNRKKTVCSASGHDMSIRVLETSVIYGAQTLLLVMLIASLKQDAHS